MRLGCFGKPSTIGDFDPSASTLVVEGDLGPSPKGPIRGHYAELGSTTAYLYFDPDRDELLLRIAGQEFAVDSHLNVEWCLVDSRVSDPRWHVRGDGHAELTVTSAESTVTVRYVAGPSDELPLALDTSAGVEYEDFDFGLYLKNMVEDGGYVAYAQSAARG